MKKYLLAVIVLFMLAFTACTTPPEQEQTTPVDTTKLFDISQPIGNQLKGNTLDEKRVSARLLLEDEAELYTFDAEANNRFNEEIVKAYKADIDTAVNSKRLDVIYRVYVEKMEIFDLTVKYEKELNAFNADIEAYDSQQFDIYWNARAVIIEAHEATTGKTEKSFIDKIAEYDGAYKRWKQRHEENPTPYSYNEMWYWKNKTDAVIVEWEEWLGDKKAECETLRQTYLDAVETYTAEKASAFNTAKKTPYETATQSLNSNIQFIESLI